MRIVVRQSLLRDRCWLLDTRYWIFRNALIVKSKNIQYPGTSIQNQPIPAMGFVVTAYIEYIILCNYRVYYMSKNCGAKLKTEFGIE